MNTNGFRRILVPTDFSPCAEAALRQAIGMAKAFGGCITLVHAYLPHFYQSPPRGFVPDEEELQRLAATSERELAALCDRYAASGVTIERRALVGAIPDAILDVAAEGYDLIAMGTHGAGGVKELFLGSVAEKAIRSQPSSTARSPRAIITPTAGRRMAASRSSGRFSNASPVSIFGTIPRSRRPRSASRS
jgi:nucleotide-binding universal stress UspA family protein